MIPGLFAIMGGLTAVAVDGTTGMNLFTIFGSPSDPIRYKLVIPAAVKLGNLAPTSTILADGLHADSIGTYIIDGYLLGGGGNGWDGGIDATDAVGGGAGAGGGAGFPAGTAGAAGGGTATGGTAGDDTSVSGLSPAGGAAGTNDQHGIHVHWDEPEYGVAHPSVATAPNAGDAIRTNHQIHIQIGDSGRLWGGGAPGIPGYYAHFIVFVGSNPGEPGMAPGVDQAFANQVSNQQIVGANGGYAVRLISGAPTPTYLNSNTGTDFIKGTVG